MSCFFHIKCRTWPAANQCNKMFIMQTEEITTNFDGANKPTHTHNHWVCGIYTVRELDAKDRERSHKKPMTQIKTPTATGQNWLSLHIIKCLHYISNGWSTKNYTCNKATKDDTRPLMLEHRSVDNFTVFRLLSKKRRDTFIPQDLYNSVR